MYSSSNWFINRLSEDDFGMISARLYAYIKFCLHIQPLIPIYFRFLTFHVCLLHWQRHIWLSQAKVPAIDWGAHS